MTSYADLERALGQLGSDEWFHPAAGVRGNSSQVQLWTEPFGVNVVHEDAEDMWVWRGDLDVTAELSFDGPVPLEWLGPIDATEAEILNIRIFFRGVPHLSMFGIAIQQGCGADSPFDPSRDFSVLPLPDAIGGVDEVTYKVLHEAVCQLASIELQDPTEIMDTLGLRPIGEVRP